MENETMVTTEEMAEDLASTDLQDEIVEEVEDEDVSLESALEDETEDAEQPVSSDEKKDSQGTREPGYVKGRIDKAVAKAIAETEARMRADFEAQMAPYREQMITMEAQELVRKGTVKDLETAKELVRYRQNQPQPPAEKVPESQPRNEKGQSSSNNEQEQRDPATSARIDMLAHQADRIKEQRGIDVIAEFNSNEDIKQKVISGEMDFYDVAEELANKSQKRKTPSPMRSPNGASGYQTNAIDSLSDEQFEKLEKRISGGARITLKR